MYGILAAHSEWVEKMYRGKIELQRHNHAGQEPNDWVLWFLKDLEEYATLYNLLELAEDMKRPGQKFEAARDNCRPIADRQV